MFSFSAQPESLQHRRRPGATAKIGNLMFDPRVRRGTTVERPPRKEEDADDGAASKRAWTLRRRRPRQREADAFEAKPPVAAPSAGVDVTRFLTEQDGPTASKPASADAVTQTEEFVERPLEPHAVAPKRGVDAEVQVDAGEIFDFAVASAPLVEVLASKTLEQALLELEEEAELAGLFAARHDLATAEERRLERVRRLDADAARRRAEAQSRLEAARRRRAEAETCRRKVLSAAVARGLASLGTGTGLAVLRSRELFQDPVRAEVEARAVVPAVEAALADVGARSVARRLADDLLGASLRRQREVRAAEVARLAAEAAERERRRPYAVSVVLRSVMPPRAPEDEEEDAEEEEEEDGEAGAGRAEALPPPGTDVTVTLGPIPVARADTAAEVEARIGAWIDAHPSRLVAALMRGRRLRLAHSGKPLDPTRTLDSLSAADLAALSLLNEPI